MPESRHLVAVARTCVIVVVRTDESEPGCRWYTRSTVETLCYPRHPYYANWERHSVVLLSKAISG